MSNAEKKIIQNKMIQKQKSEYENWHEAKKKWDGKSGFWHAAAFWVEENSETWPESKSELKRRWVEKKQVHNGSKAKNR